MKDNIEGLVNEMLGNLPSFSKDLSFQRNVIGTIMDVCTSNSYENITNFEWLTCHVMFTLAQQNPLARKDFEGKISQVLIDVASRLEDVRADSITKKCFSLF